MNFDVRVPYGVGFVGRTVNGEISGETLQGDAEAHTVNGSVRLTTTGLAVANTSRLGERDDGRADWPNGVTFKTVNGGITLTCRAPSKQSWCRTLNGSITAEFPITAPVR